MIQFFIRCEPDSELFYAVEIYPTEQEMQTAVGKMRGYPLRSDQDIRALCLRYVAEGRNEKGRLVRTGELGTIFFHQSDLDGDVVVHELTHAAIGWAKRARVNPCSKNGEERFACVSQSLFQQTKNQMMKAFGIRANPKAA